MSNYTIYTDAAADLPLEWYGQYEIRGVPMEYTLSGQTHTILPGELEKEKICDSFYDTLRRGEKTSTTFSKKALLKNGHKSAAFVAQCSIYTVGAFLILSQLGIAKELVNAAFILILAALAVAFSISFGIGGKEFAGRTLEKLEGKFQDISQKETPEE